MPQVTARRVGAGARTTCVTPAAGVRALLLDARRRRAPKARARALVLFVSPDGCGCGWSVSRVRLPGGAYPPCGASFRALATGDVMDLGTAHVVAAAASLALGLVVLVRRKGDAWHVRLGRAYLIAMLAVSVPVLFVYEMTGGPGPFHALAVVSLLTTASGWLAVRRRKPRPGVVAHGMFMVWSWIGVVTAGLAQLANHMWPVASPWPVLVVVAGATAVGAVGVPRFVSRTGARGTEERATPVLCT